MKWLRAIPAALLVSCSTPVWVKPGGTQEAFSTDKYDCAERSKHRASEAYINAYGGAATDGVVINEELFAACMNSKGWYLQSHSQATSEKRAGIGKGRKADVAVSAVGDLDRRYTATCSKEEYRSLVRRIPCDISELNLEQLSNSDHMLPDEKVLFMQFFQETQKINAAKANAYRTTGDAIGLKLADLMDRLMATREQLALQLYEGSISWGEFNKQRKLHTNKLREERRSIVGGAGE
jgi:hypothetical protein